MIPALMILVLGPGFARSEESAMSSLETMAGSDAARAGLHADGGKLRSGKGLATFAAEAVVGAAFKLDKALSPHKPFTRPPAPLDARPLREQAADMSRDIRSRYLVDDRRLFLYMKPMSLGDMNIWQGVYLAMTVLRQSSEPGPENLRDAEKAFDGLALMYRPGLPLLRGVLPPGVRHLDETDPHHRVEGGYQTLDTASIDSAAGWVFGMVMAERHLPSRRPQARELLRRFADDLIANDFALKNRDGSDTEWGNMGKGRSYSPPPGVLSAMAALSQADRHSPDQRYWRILKDFSAKRQDLWGSYGSMPKLWHNMTTNHNIGYLALSAALLSEQDPDRWLRYARGMIRLAEYTAEPDGNSFWLYLTYWTLEQRPEMLARHSGDKPLSAWRSRRARNMALAEKTMLEFSTPKCGPLTPQQSAFCSGQAQARWPLSGRKTSPQPIPMWCRRSDFNWQRNAYDPESCRDREFTNFDFLIAYYLALQNGALGAAP